jgi:transmembrane sensor
MHQQDPDNYYHLLSQKLLEGTITDTEKEELAQWLNNDNADPLFIPDNFATSYNELELKMLQGLRSNIASQKPAKIISLRSKWWAAAAILIGVFFGAGYFLYNNNPSKENIPVAVNDIAPGYDKAILTLGDGSTILLDSAATGKLITQGNAQIIKDAHGVIGYDVIQADTKDVVYNTMSTPRGGQYQLRLPDGTKAWLNAASSITYPTVFTGENRTVSITGEIYFEIATNKSMPFLVKVNPATNIEVLGTHFNVNAYTDESAVVTTLIEGSIKTNNKILQPGEASINGKIIKADVEQAVAWKNGAFNFENCPLSQALRQISRWYDVEIVYEGKVPDKVFGGEIGRDLNLSQVLDVLKSLHVKFTIHGKKLIVSA